MKKAKKKKKKNKKPKPVDESQPGEVSDAEAPVPAKAPANETGPGQDDAVETPVETVSEAPETDVVESIPAEPTATGQPEPVEERPTPVVVEQVEIPEPEVKERAPATD